jgi:hypothetical protein
VILGSRRRESSSASAASRADGLDLWHAHQYCFVVTLSQALPWFFAVLVALYTLAHFVTVPLAILAGVIQLLMLQAVAFTHIAAAVAQQQEEGEENEG